jgi:hypothetical protein
VLLTTETPLADAGVLEGRAVRTRAIGSGLDRLLGDAGAYAKSWLATTSVDWGLQRVSLRSLPRGSR